MAICLHSVDSFETGAQYLQPCSLCTSVTVDSFKTGAIPIWLKGVCVFVCMDMLTVHLCDSGQFEEWCKVSCSCSEFHVRC